MMISSSRALIFLFVLLSFVSSSFEFSEDGGSLGETQRRSRRRLTLNEDKHYLVVLKNKNHYYDIDSISPPSASYHARSASGRHVAEDINVEEELVSDGSVIRVQFRSQKALDRVHDDVENVEYIEEDLIAHAVKTQYNARYFLDHIDGEKDMRFSYDYDGEGVNVYILDTGIRRTHEEFAGRAFFGKDFINKKNNGKNTNPDVNGHGSHCAGSAVGTKYGVAKKSHVYDVRVLGDHGTGPFSGIINAVSWASDHALSQGRKAVLSLSLSGGYSYAMNFAVRQAVNEKNAIVVVAAGNEANDACSSSPASEPLAVTVGALDSTEGAASFTNWGKCVDIFAPGVGVLSASNGNDGKYVTMSGTSMATPIVAGAFAMLSQKEEQSGKTNKELISILVNKLSSRSYIKGLDGTESPMRSLRVPRAGNYSDYEDDEGDEEYEPEIPYGTKVVLVNGVQQRFGYAIDFGTPLEQFFTSNMTAVYATPENGCNPFKKYSVDPVNSDLKLALLVKRGECSFYEKSLNAQNFDSRIKAVVIYDNVYDENPPLMRSPNPGSGVKINLPLVSLTLQAGLSVKDRIDSGLKTLITLGTKGYTIDYPTYAPTTDSPTLKPTLIPTATPTTGSPTYKPGSRYLADGNYLKKRFLKWAKQWTSPAGKRLCFYFNALSPQVNRNPWFNIFITQKPSTRPFFNSPWSILAGFSQKSVGIKNYFGNYKSKFGKNFDFSLNGSGVKLRMELNAQALTFHKVSDDGSLVQLLEHSLPNPLINKEMYHFSFTTPKRTTILFDEIKPCEEVETPSPTVAPSITRAPSTLAPTTLAPTTSPPSQSEDHFFQDSRFKIFIGDAIKTYSTNGEDEFCFDFKVCGSLPFYLGVSEEATGNLKVKQSEYVFQIGYKNKNFLSLSGRKVAKSKNQFYLNPMTTCQSDTEFSNLTVMKKKSGKLLIAQDYFKTKPKVLLSYFLRNNNKRRNRLRGGDEVIDHDYSIRFLSWRSRGFLVVRDMKSCSNF